MKRILLPLLFLFLFISESVFVQMLPTELFYGKYILAPRFLLSAILFLAIFGPKNRGILYGFIFGLLFDIVYTEIIGIYFFVFPLAAYLISRMMRVLQSNLLIASFVVLLGVSLVEMGIFGINRLIHVTDIKFSDFVTIRFIPVLILNFLFIILSAYPFKQGFEKVAEDELL